MTNQNLHDAFAMIERLAAISATAQISEETRKAADEQIKKLIEGPIKSAVTTLAAKGQGIITS